MSRKLYRSNREKKIGGVAGGLSEYFDIDPTIVRILFVVGIFFHGVGLIAYILLWIIVPEEPFAIPAAETNSAGSASTDENFSDEEKHDPVKTYFEQKEKEKQKRTNIAAFVLIAIGALFLLDNFIPRFFIGDLWPLILIAIGTGLLLNSKK